MKRTLLFTLIVLITINVFGQEEQETKTKDSTWTTGGLFAFTLAQANFSNWAAGGENSYSANGKLGLSAIRAKNKTIWENNLDLAYGITEQGNLGLRKTDDLAELNSKFGIEASKKWYYSAVFNAKTQFADGYEYPEEDSLPDIKSSEAFAPLYLNGAIGMDYKPNKFLSVFVSPANIKHTYIHDVKYAERYSIDSAKHSRTDIGAFVNCKYEQEVVKNVNILSKLDLFADYINMKSMEDIDVSWEVLVTMKVYKALSVNLNTHLIWDNNVKSVNSDGTLGDAKLQFKEIFGAGLAYKF